MVPRIFVSVPDDCHLDNRRLLIKRAILRAVKNENVHLVGFEPEQFGTGAPKALNHWTIDRAQALLRQCDGIIVLALACWHAQLLPAAASQSTSTRVPVPTPYNHLEGAIGLALGLPLLLVMEAGMMNDGIFASGVKAAVIPVGANSKWVQGNTFTNHLPGWLGQINARRDVFLGYCSKGSAVAREIRDDLEMADYSVLDWSRDFKVSGTTIFEEIERAASLCRTAIFLFTRDDELDLQATGQASFDAVPRDNVLFEAGYFMQVRGKSRVAIVREEGTKMPADLGGVIYLSFSNRGKLQATKKGLRRFMAQALMGDASVAAPAGEGQIEGRPAARASKKRVSQRSSGR